MFYQVKVPKHQYNHLRFLWWPNGDISKELEEYWMKVHLFGAVSSPSIANYALRRVADEGSNLGSEVAHTIKRNFYVDDCLKSVPNATEASSLIAELTAACGGCGFKLCKYTSNDVSVLNTIPADDRSKELKTRDINYDPLPTEHPLGILWVVETDTFGFSVLLPNKPLTRRGILSIVSSIYDPLGFAAPFVLLAKQILQDLCKETTLTWDDEVPDDHQQRFKQWISEAPNLQKITIPRCLKLPQQTKDTAFRMHVFSDASTSGYGAVAYLTSNEGGCSKTSFLIGKARVAPLKATSIPRLELTAAAVAVNLGQKMTLELDLHLNEVCYYTDSTTVLYYIRAERKRFPVFVANRVRQIRDFSNVNQWKYISTDLNPADVASRGVGSVMSSDMTHWLEGPDFLNMPASECPAKMHPSTEPQVTEEDFMSLATTATSEEGSPFMSLITHFSRWERLKRAVAVFIAFLAFLRNKEQTINLRTTQIMQKAEKAIVCFIQKITFANEVENLKKTTTKEDKREHSLPKTSTIFRLDPVLIDGTLRVGGRLSKAAMDSDVKHPMLLPQHSHVTTLIIRDAHERLGHAGRNHTIAAIRERFWIVSINSAVRRQLHKCITCRKMRKPCQEQKMSDLPQDRLEPAPPFTFTGVDFFGPFIIKEGRKELKRYGVIFTCLVSRSIHLEAANSLETDSFIHCLQRFIARRGTVQEIRCDNGTNFIGTRNELNKAWSDLNQNKIQNKLLYMNIDWKLNPPMASHMGGVWERQIRTIRKVLSALFYDHGTRLDDESFRTLLCEVEYIVNSRPITTCSDDPDDMEPLSPSQILHMKSPKRLIPGPSQPEYVYSRKRWRRVQYLSDLFWSRWKREYIVSLQQRPKWNKQQRNTREGDIVLLKDENTPRLHWPLARVTEVLPDSRGVVRSVKLRTQSSELHRPVSKLVLLLPKEDQVL
ncbi:uncharacterized protein [Macrobrachium rosenbergii]|uniref:uncharacterized protein n=1 Tax=Macrobrachium rosenbergii TaxID=79674 RepID=UPI0034D42078